MAKAPADVEFQVRWLPYELLPHLSEMPISRKQAYMQRFMCSEEQVGQMAQSMAATFARVGLKYGLEAQLGTRTLISNTKEAHRIMAAAYITNGQEAQDRAAEVLFRGYFSEGRAPNDQGTLREAAKAAGLDPGIVDDRRFARAEVEAELQEGRRMVTRGVPHFKISSESGEAVAEFSGAQPAEYMLRALAAAVR